jgi:hypothetical protein
MRTAIGSASTAVRSVASACRRPASARCRLRSCSTRPVISSAWIASAASVPSTKLRWACHTLGSRNSACAPSGTRSGAMFHFSSERQFTRSGVSGSSSAMLPAGVPASSAATAAAATRPISRKSVIAPPRVPFSTWLPKVP